jgi:hypothetical protein
MNKRGLYIAAKLCGLVPLIGGLLIFFTWWIARDSFAFDFKQLVGIGFFWIIISVLIAFGGLFLIAIFSFLNFPKYSRHSLIVVVIILLNIPTALYILDRQEVIHKRAYIKITNKTQNDMDVFFVYPNNVFYFGNVVSDKSKVNYFVPDCYIDYPNDEYTLVDSIDIVAKYSTISRNFKVRRIDVGVCRQYTIDKDYNLIIKENE